MLTTHEVLNKQDVLDELDELANIYGWHKPTCGGHSHHPACPVVRIRRMIASLEVQNGDVKIETVKKLLGEHGVTAPNMMATVLNAPQFIALLELENK